MSVSSGSDITIPIQDSPPPPPSPYAGGTGSKGKDDRGSSKKEKNAAGGAGAITVIDTSGQSQGQGGSGQENGKKTPEPRGDVTVTVGFVNEAYQDHSPEQNHQITEKNGKMKNGGSKNGAISIAVPGENGQKGGGGGDANNGHLNEAVNPELINMNILNTIPDKPNPEYGPYDNMDEYFVPVNQHKKFLRSEKLYVTKDKRKDTRWKKYVCWLIGASILATIVTVAVLAGIGLIPQKAQTNFKEFVATTTTTERETSREDDAAISSSSPGSWLPLPSSTEINTPPSLPDDSTYVPMAADIEFRITDLFYEPALNDKNSERFYSLSTELQDEIRKIVREKAGINYVSARVSEFSPGSVHAKMRLGWFDQSVDFQRVKLMLSTNVTSVGPYQINPISTYEVVNHCKFNKNGCSHNCSYNYTSMDFYCYCNDQTFYLADDAKTCVSMYDVSSTSPSGSGFSSSGIPSFPEFSSPESLPPISEEYDHSHGHTGHDSTHIAVPDEEEATTNQPEQEEEHSPVVPEQSHEHEHEQDHGHHDHVDVESSTEAELPAGETEPVSHEQHHHSEEMLHFSSSTTEEPQQPVSEEVTHEHQHHHDLGASVPIAAETTTTTSTTTTTTTEAAVLPNSSEEIVPIEAHTVQPDHESHEQQDPETTDVPVPTQNQSGEELGRTDVDNDEAEIGHPTEQPEVQPPPVESHPISAENATVHESVRNTSPEEEEKQQEEEAAAPVPESPVTTLEDEEEQVPVTTALPPVHSLEHEDPEEKTKPVETHSESLEADQDVTTIAPTVEVNSDKEEDVVDGGVIATTLPPEIFQDERDDESHHITPMDVLSFSHAASTTTTTAMPSTTSSSTTEVPETSGSEELPQGRSAEVESIHHQEAQSPVRSESLTEGADETATENNNNREPRVYSDELSNSMQLLTNDDIEEEKKSSSGERDELAQVVPIVAPEEQAQNNQNVTESASVETADEKPEVASEVTSVSSEERGGMGVAAGGASAELGVTQMPENEGSEDESSQSGSSEGNNNISGGSGSGSVSSELSQESPVQPQPQSASVEREIDSGERTTFTPLSLKHDIDINYLGNLTEDHTNSEPAVVSPLPPVAEVEELEGSHVVSGEESEKDKEKLLQQPEVEVEPEVTTALPVQDNQSQSAEELVPVPVVPDPVSASGETTRGVTSGSGSLENQDQEEPSNRDHRDTNRDIETPFVSSRDSSGSGSSESFEDDSKSVSGEDAVTESFVPGEIEQEQEQPETLSTSTATSTTTTTTSTTTTPAVPIEEVTTTIPTTTTTSTTVAPPPPEETASKNSTASSDDAQSQEASRAESDSHSHVNVDSHSPDNNENVSAASHELEQGSLEPLLSGSDSTSGSASNEGASLFPSSQSSSVQDNSSDSDSDLHDNELT